MKIPYFPGCALKTIALGFESSAIASALALEIELEEMPRWNCCGTVYSLASDNLMFHLAPVRNLIRIMEGGDTRVVTLCSMCYNTLKQSNLRAKNSSEDLRKMNAFMDEESDYDGSVDVLHFLEVLRDEIGFGEIQSKVSKPLEGLNVSPYYGCLLLRPKEAAIDDPERPVIFRELMGALGATAIEDRYQKECCGAYHTVANKDVVTNRVHKILDSAVKSGADMVVTSCPLCAFNLDERQKVVRERFDDFKNIPVLYFTQLMALALSLNEETCDFDKHVIDPRPVLREKGVID